MTVANDIQPSADAPTHRPQWDGGRVLFEVADHGDVVLCAISRDALELVSGHRAFRPADILSRFAATRDRIEILALAKLHARADGGCGRLTLWADDIDPPPPPGADIAGQRAAGV